MSVRWSPAHGHRLVPGRTGGGGPVAGRRRGAGRRGLPGVAYAGPGAAHRRGAPVCRGLRRGRAHRAASEGRTPRAGGPLPRRSPPPGGHPGRRGARRGVLHLSARTALAFRARRQAYETTVHRFDAESARGGTPSPITADLAVDGVDGLPRGFHARPGSRVPTRAPRVPRVRATDADAAWTVRLSREPPETTGDATVDAECELAGPAARLCPALWKRAPVSGDPGLAALRRETSAVLRGSLAGPVSRRPRASAPAPRAGRAVPRRAAHGPSA